MSSVLQLVPHISCAFPAFVITGLPLRPISSGDFGPSYRPRFHPLNLGTWYVLGVVFLFCSQERNASMYVNARQ